MVVHVSLMIYAISLFVNDKGGENFCVDICVLWQWIYDICELWQWIYVYDTFLMQGSTEIFLYFMQGRTRTLDLLHMYLL